MTETDLAKKPMMRCGHRANATCEGKPSCVICAPKPKSFEFTAEPDLSKRKCICYSCNKIVSSTSAVAFFEYRPNKEFDNHYDGCRGWD